jgi:hypothetical protein
MKTSFWTLINQNKIEIPIIQRDYAQGRIEESRIARRFIRNIKSKLVSEEKLNLDFVYGKINNKVLIPLDGQQRLTTLYLLHWFLASKENKNADLPEEIKNALLNFSYETRPSSQDFFKKLVNDGISKINHQELLSASIEKQKWFSLSWKSDPTIKAVLNMLNIIQEMFMEVDARLFNKLISDECLITFNYLPLDKFKLTDELYIKMNSRGKPLTEFENFKANFSNFLEENEKSKLDNEWYDIFWKLESGNTKLETKNIDNQFYNFFSNITLNFYVEKKDIDKSFIDNYYLFDHYEGIYKKSKLTVQQIRSILDALKTYEDDAKYFEDFIKSTSITYWERVRFYAVTKFFIKQGEINDANKIMYNNWMRVCKNLINNSLIQNPAEYFTAVRSIDKLSEGLEIIYNYIINSDFVPGFIKIQQEEERIKAELIGFPNTDWEKEIIEIENHPYLDGQIGFILNFSKINGIYDLSKFKSYSNILNTIFTQIKDSKNFLFQRALFACGYFIIDISSSKTFCNFETGLRSKMDNWRKVFNDEKKSLILKILLDKITLENIEIDLNKIATDYNINDWKSIFINNLRILPHCCNFQIKKNKNKIYLSRSTANNWKRKAELYTFDLFTTKIENNPIHPFNRSGYHETVDEPCAFIDKWCLASNNFAIDIFFDNGFMLSFFDRNGNQFPEDLIENLEDLSFVENNDRYELKTEFMDKNEIYNLLISICTNLTTRNI